MRTVGLIVFAVSFVFYIIADVFLMLIVGNDARAIGVKKRSEWMALVFFVPVSAVAYAIVRKSVDKIVPKYCYDCKSVIEPNSKMCPNCGSMSIADMYSNDRSRHIKKAKICAVLAVVFLFLSVVTSAGAGIAYALGYVPELYSNNQYDDSVEDFLDDYSEYDFGEDFINPEDFLNQFGY